MEQQLWPDHRGMWVVKVPNDMPITIIAMLQATVAEAWKSYGGDPGNAEQFFNHLVAGGMANVPRETSPSVEDKFPFDVDVTYKVNRGAWRTAQRRVLARDGREAVDLAKAKVTAVFGDDDLFFGSTYAHAVPDGGRIVDVPRET